MSIHRVPIRRRLPFQARRPFGMVLSMVLVAATTACAGSAPSTGSEGGKVRVGIICGGMTPMATQVAINADTFSDDIEVEKLCFDNGSQAVQALLGRSLDVFMGSTEHILSTRAEGLPTRGYAGINERPPYALLTAEDSDVQEVSDLEGETVGVTETGSLSDTELHMAARDGGISYDDMEVIGAGSGSPMAAAIREGQVAAGMVSEPQKSALVQGGDYRVLWEPSQRYASIVALASEEWVGKNEDTMRAFLAGVSDGAEQTSQDTGFAVEAMNEEDFGVDEQVLNSAVEEGERSIPPDLTISEDVYSDTTEVLVEAGIIEEAGVAGYDEVFDFSLLPEQP